MAWLDDAGLRMVAGVRDYRGSIAGEQACEIQLMSSAELSLWARIDGLERGALDEALWTHRALVKLWASPRSPGTSASAGART